jgi:hypothetical protein
MLIEHGSMRPSNIGIADASSSALCRPLYRRVASILRESLPVSDWFNHVTLRNRALQVGERIGGIPPSMDETATINSPADWSAAIDVSSEARVVLLSNEIVIPPRRHFFPWRLIKIPEGAFTKGASASCAAQLGRSRCLMEAPKHAQSRHGGKKTRASRQLQCTDNVDVDLFGSAAKLMSAHRYYRLNPSHHERRKVSFRSTPTPVSTKEYARQSSQHNDQQRWRTPCHQ